MSTHHAHKQRAAHPEIHAAFIQKAITPAQVSEKLTGVPASITMA